MKSYENEFKKSSSSTSTIIEYSGMSYMNFDKSWIMNYGSSLREKEENFHNLCFESSQLWNITSKAHKIRTTLKRRWIFKRASGKCCLHDAGKTQPPRKAAAAAAAAAAIPCQHIRGQSPTAEKISAFGRTEFGLWFLNDIRGEDMKQNAHLQVRLLRHHDGRHGEEAREQRIGRWYFQYWERGSLQNPKIKWKETSRVRIGRIAFTAEAWNLWIGRFSCNPKTISGLFHQAWWITQKNPYKSVQVVSTAMPAKQK